MREYPVPEEAPRRSFLPQIHAFDVVIIKTRVWKENRLTGFGEDEKISLYPNGE